MAIIPWLSQVDPFAYIPGRQIDQITHRGFTVKRAPVLTRSVLWRMTITWPTMTHDERNFLDGYIERLHAGELVARVPFGFHQRRQGGGTGTPTTSATSAGADTVTTSGWGGSSPYLLRGDMVGFQSTVGGQEVVRVHRITDPLSTGDLNMNLWPPLREAVLGGQAIYFMPSTVGGSDGRLQPARNSNYLECCMALEDPSGFESNPHPSNAAGHYGNASSLAFIEVIQENY